MSTPSISNALNAVMPTPQTGKAGDAAAADGTFNQMLTREMGLQNRDTAQTNKATDNNAQGTRKDGTDAGKTKNDSASAADGNGTPADGTKAADDKTAQAADGKTADKDDKQADAATEPSDILAFVTALTQAGANGNATPVSASDEIKDRIAAAIDGGKGIDGKAAPVAFGTAPIEDKTGPAANKQADFVASLDKAMQGKETDTGKTATTAAKSGNADMAAAVQAAVAKSAEQATVPTPQNIAAVAVATTAALQQHVNELQDPQSNRLLPQVGTDDWGQSLGQKVVWMIQGAQQSATLTLNPPDLGPMQVVLHVNNNQATANFTAHQPEVRHALEAAMPRLREMLSESGIQLGQSNVSAGLPNQQNNASGDQRQNGRPSGQGSNAVETAAVNVSHVPVTAAGNGLVDTFA
ncbi:flagellar hook-length control protein FliK [Oxalicibacterium solurbis]|uniref:Flagellar hook-length control protein FliK n=1 Tax=Oxalicibacterium solurbis TaxID=69280 RepID=A0A8J3B1D4_9BURK|nr:flagellar hook-length control protein FliK [Oxalicibacterium solurbis]GGI53040.1 flagellar hook-length control protein FliK [Oxalicibacterium solurbis]